MKTEAMYEIIWLQSTVFMMLGLAIFFDYFASESIQNFGLGMFLTGLGLMVSGLCVNTYFSIRCKKLSIESVKDVHKQ